MAILVALVFVVPSASATDEDLQTDINGDNGPISYASAYGHAQFIGEVSSASGAAHEDVTVTVSFDEGSDWSADQATISDCSGNGTTGSKNMGDLAEGETIEFCISVMTFFSSYHAIMLHNEIFVLLFFPILKYLHHLYLGAL